MYVCMYVCIYVCMYLVDPWPVCWPEAGALLAPGQPWLRIWRLLSSGILRRSVTSSQVTLSNVHPPDMTGGFLSQQSSSNHLIYLSLLAFLINSIFLCFVSLAFIVALILYLSLSPASLSISISMYFYLDDVWRSTSCLPIPSSPLKFIRPSGESSKSFMAKATSADFFIRPKLERGASKNYRSLIWTIS